MIIGGFDLSTRRCGYCIGGGEDVPIADAILLPQVGDDIGRMLDLFDKHVRVLHQRLPADLWVLETPILVVSRQKADGSWTRGDKPDVLRKLYSIAGHLEWLGKKFGVAVEEADVKRLKRELAGFSQAKKADMVFAAQRAGVKLPATIDEGREDAADAFAAWLAGLRAHGRRDIIHAWDRRLLSPRGVLL